MYSQTTDSRRRISTGLGLSVGVIAAALAGSPLAAADESRLTTDVSPLAAIGEPPCGADVCGTTFGPFEPYFPFEYDHQYVPADDYASDGFYYYPFDSSSDGIVGPESGFDIVSGHSAFLADTPGIAGETVLYTLNDGTWGDPIELLPFELPL